MHDGVVWHRHPRRRQCCYCGCRRRASNPWRVQQDLASSRNHWRSARPYSHMGTQHRRKQLRILRGRRRCDAVRHMDLHRRSDKRRSQRTRLEHVVLVAGAGHRCSGHGNRRGQRFVALHVHHRCRCWCIRQICASKRCHRYRHHPLAHMGCVNRSNVV